MVFMMELVPDKYVGLDIKETAARINRLIKEKGLNDRKLSEMLNLSVQSINKWRHGHNLPDIENLYNLGRILGKKIDDLLVPYKQIVFLETIDENANKISSLQRIKEYATRLKLCS